MPRPRYGKTATRAAGGRSPAGIVKDDLLAAMRRERDAAQVRLEEVIGERDKTVHALRVELKVAQNDLTQERVRYDRLLKVAQTYERALKATRSLADAVLATGKGTVRDA